MGALSRAPGSRPTLRPAYVCVLQTEQRLGQACGPSGKHKGLSAFANGDFMVPFPLEFCPRESCTRGWKTRGTKG